MQIQIPNFLTLMRISLIPIFVVVFYLPFEWRYIATASIFAVAGFTDWLDGYLARRLHQLSALGEFLDPVADKLLVAVALVLLAQTHGTPWIAIPAAVIVSREITISALREWMAELGKRCHVAVSWIGKIKTVLQMLSITLLLADSPHSYSSVKVLGYILLYCSVMLTLWSMIAYLKAAWQDILKS